MISNIILGALGISTIALGLKGFSKEGIPWSTKTNITGEKAKAIGTICIIFGGLLLLAALFMLFIQAGRQ